MQTDQLAFISFLLLVLTSFTLLLSADWRWGILALAGQYMGVFLLVWLSWPLEMAVVKLVAGWMAGAILGTTLVNLSDEDRASPPQINRVFRFLLGCLVLLIVFSVSPAIVEWVPDASIVQVWGFVLLVGMGILNLGLTTRPLRIILALLTILAGFEIIYATVESSTLVAGMLAGVNLGLAMVGAYLLAAPHLREF